VSKATGTSQVRYYWDDEDKMVRVEDSVVMNFKVDGLGFRRFKEVVGQYQRWFVYDLGASEVPGLAPLVAEYDGNGNLVAKYHYDGGGLIAMTRNNQSYWYGFEAIGTVRQLMGSQGQVVDAYAFDAWGNEITNPQSQVPNPFKYVGKHGYYLDTESALMLLGVRYYGNRIGRFISLDPIMEGLNWYSYVGSNPVKNTDPCGAGVGVIIGIGIIGIGVIVYSLLCYRCAEVIREAASRIPPQGGRLDTYQHCWANCHITAICGEPCGLVAIFATELGGVWDWEDVKANYAGYLCGTPPPVPPIIRCLSFASLSRCCDKCCRSFGYRP